MAHGWTRRPGCVVSLLSVFYWSKFSMRMDGRGDHVLALSQECCGPAPLCDGGQGFGRGQLPIAPPCPLGCECGGGGSHGADRRFGCRALATSPAPSTMVQLRHGHPC